VITVAVIDEDADLELIAHATRLGPTVALSATPAPGGDALLCRAIELGAERAVRVWDELIGACDYLGIAHVLAAAARRIAEDAPLLVLAGDRGRGAVGPAIAERLSVPHLCRVAQVVARDGRLVAKRRGQGIVRLYAAPPPAVLCLLLGAQPPAKVTEAQSRPIELWSLADVQVAREELHYRRRFRPRPGSAPPRQPALLPDVAALADRLAQSGLLPPRRPLGGA
jgi:electron transfer flavoprotein beta subunit